MNRYKTIKEYKTEFENPISVSKGEEVVCLQRSDPNGDWPNWVLCKTSDNEGWIPEQIIEHKNNKYMVVEDYNAREFNLDIGDILIEEKMLNGWIWGYKEGDTSHFAWAPLNCIERI